MTATGPGAIVIFPSGSSFPDYDTVIDPVTDADGNPTDLITPDEGTVTVSGTTDASPTDGTVQVFLTKYQESAGLPDAGGDGIVVASAETATATDLNEKDSKGNELYGWSVTLPTNGLADGVYDLRSFVYAEGVVETNGVPTAIYGDISDQATVTVDEFEPFTYVVRADTEVVSVGTAQSGDVVDLSGADSSVQLSTDGRYAVWSNGDTYEEDLQTGYTIDLTATKGTAPALQTSLAPTESTVASPNPYGPQDSGAYEAISYPTFVEGGVTFSSIPDFNFNANDGSQSPLPTATDASGNTAVLAPFGTTPTMVGYAVAASDNGNAVLTVEPYDVTYLSPYSGSGTEADPQYDVVYRSPAPDLSIEPISQYEPGIVSLSGASDAYGQTVEIDFDLGQAQAEVAYTTVQPDGSWSYNYNASTTTGPLTVEASVMSAEGTPANVTDTLQYFPADVFSDTQAETSGALAGAFLWSDARNWSEGVPSYGAVEMTGVTGVDDIAGLSLDSLSLVPASGNTGALTDLYVEANLAVRDLVVDASTALVVISTGQQDNTLDVTGPLINDGLIAIDPSEFLDQGGITGTGTIDIGAGSNLIISGGAAATQTIDFLSNTGTLTVNDPADFHATVIGDGTEIIVCYLRGTRLRTPDGEVEIERLSIGDRLVTRFGGVQCIKWIGRQSFAARFLAANRAQWPVRIEAGALKAGLPARDLSISPGHSMLVEDRLILARNLVNGVSITQSPPVEDVHYYQIEFETQDCVMAEGAWSESYADDEALRNQFHNVAEFRALFPDYRSPPEPRLCAPRPTGGPELAAALNPILARAAAGVTPGPLRGWIDTADVHRIAGWAQDMAYPEMPVLLDLRLDGILLGTALACEFRADLEAAGIGRGYCSFDFAVPTAIPAEALRTLIICRAKDGAGLPMTAALQARFPTRSDEAVGPLRGWIDAVEPSHIAGWAQDMAYPERPVLLDIQLRGEHLGTVLACAYRADLREAGIGRGYCSFRFATPPGFAATSLRDLVICRAADGATLPMTAALAAKAA
jgi:hypothetical protein